MSWTKPGQGYLEMWTEASYVNSKFKFQQWGKHSRSDPQRFEGIGNAKGASVDWSPGYDSNWKERQKELGFK